MLEAWKGGLQPRVTCLPIHWLPSLSSPSAGPQWGGRMLQALEKVFQEGDLSPQPGEGY